jgi:HEAT repeat protein
MAVTFKQVVEVLDPDEPEYASAATLGPDALPHLRTLIEGDDRAMASKAVVLAGRIPGERSAELLSLAAGSREPAVRVAAAFAARNLPETVREDLLLRLLEDSDLGVRKFALKAVPPTVSPAVRTKVSALSESEEHPALRELSRTIIARSGGSDPPPRPS